MYQYCIARESDPSNIVATGNTVGTSVVSYVTVLVNVRYRITVTARTGGGFGTPVSKVIFSPEPGKCFSTSFNTVAIARKLWGGLNFLQKSLNLKSANAYRWLVRKKCNAHQSCPLHYHNSIVLTKFSFVSNNYTMALLISIVLNYAPI
jgi:hypothetical protein